MEHGEDLTTVGGSDDLEQGDAVADKVIGIVSEVLQVPRATLAIGTMASDLDGWDSFAHVRIVLATDSAFSIRLSMEAIERIDGIEALIEAVEDAQAAS